MRNLHLLNPPTSPSELGNEHTEGVGGGQAFTSKKTTNNNIHLKCTERKIEWKGRRGCTARPRTGRGGKSTAGNRGSPPPRCEQSARRRPLEDDPTTFGRFRRSVSSLAGCSAPQVCHFCLFVCLFLVCVFFCFVFFSKPPAVPRPPSLSPCIPAPSPPSSDLSARPFCTGCRLVCD